MLPSAHAAPLDQADAGAPRAAEAAGAGGGMAADPEEHGANFAKFGEVRRVLLVCFMLLFVLANVVLGV